MLFKTKRRGPIVPRIKSTLQIPVYKLCPYWSLILPHSALCSHAATETQTCRHFFSLLITLSYLWAFVTIRVTWPSLPVVLYMATTSHPSGLSWKAILREKLPVYHTSSRLFCHLYFTLQHLIYYFSNIYYNLLPGKKREALSFPFPPPCWSEWQHNGRSSNSINICCWTINWTGGWILSLLTCIIYQLHCYTTRCNAFNLDPNLFELFLPSSWLVRKLSKAKELKVWQPLTEIVYRKLPGPLWSLQRESVPPLYHEQTLYAHFLRINHNYRVGWLCRICLRLCESMVKLGIKSEHYILKSRSVT